MKKITVLFLFIALIAGCPQRKKQDIDWSVSEDRVTVFGVLNGCDCDYADIEMLVTDENTGKDYVAIFTVQAGVRFERPVGVMSDWLSIDLQIVDTR